MVSLSWLAPLTDTHAQMEYREQVIFPKCCADHGALVNQMIVCFDAGQAGISTLKLLKYLPVTLGLNAEVRFVLLRSQTFPFLT